MPRIAAALLVLTLSSSAAADEPEKRAVPDYDGRPDEPPSAGEVLIWIPRTLLFPAYLVSEYVIRQPVGALITWLDRSKAITRFLAGSGPIGGFPTVLIDFGLRPSFGMYVFADPLFHEDNRFRISGAYGGEDWLTLAAKDRLLLGSRAGGEIVLQGGYSRRSDYPFYGIGPGARQEDETFYLLEHSEISLFLAIRRRYFTEEAGVRLFRDTRDASSFGRSTQQYFATERIPGWNGATLNEQFIRLAVDSRPTGSDFALSPGSGIRFEAEGGLAFGLENAARRRYVRYGGELSLFWDITGTRRVLGLDIQVREVDALGGQPVPMSYLLQMGGRENMRGFFLGRFVGQSTVDVMLAYRWSIASFLDAELFAGAGNAFGHRFAGFAPGALIGDGGMAIRTNTSRDLSIDLIVAVGTNRFDEGPLSLESFRVTLGANRGF